MNFSPGPPLGSAKPVWEKLGKCKRKKKGEKHIKPQSAARRNDGIISYGNENAVIQVRIFESSTKGPAVIECHSQGLVWMTTVRDAV